MRTAFMDLGLEPMFCALVDFLFLVFHLCLYLQLRAIS